MTVRLQDHLPFEAFVLLDEYKRRYPFPLILAPTWKRANTLSRTWRQQHKQVKDRLFGERIRSFMHAKWLAGDLDRISNGCGRHTIFTGIWEIMLSIGHADHNMVRMFDDIMTQASIDPIEDQYLERSYVAMCEIVNSGNIPWEMVGMYGECVNTIQFCIVEFRNWVPVFGTPDQNGSTFVELPQLIV